MSKQTPPAEGFGVTIRQERKARGWTQAELGDRAGLSRPTIARVESGNDVSTTTLRRIAEVLGLTLRIELEE